MAELDKTAWTKDAFKVALRTDEAANFPPIPDSVLKVRASGENTFELSFRAWHTLWLLWKVRVMVMMAKREGLSWWRPRVLWAIARALVLN